MYILSFRKKDNVVIMEIYNHSTGKVIPRIKCTFKLPELCSIITKLLDVGSTYLSDHQHISNSEFACFPPTSQWHASTIHHLHNRAHLNVAKVNSLMMRYSLNEDMGEKDGWDVLCMMCMENYCWTPIRVSSWLESEQDKSKDSCYLIKCIIYKYKYYFMV